MKNNNRNNFNCTRNHNNCDVDISDSNIKYGNKW